MPEPTVKVRCISCCAERDISPREVLKNEVPICAHCYLPMVAVSANTDGTAPDA